jgi:hypothetical protein
LGVNRGAGTATPTTSCRICYRCHHRFLQRHDDDIAAAEGHRDQLLGRHDDRIEGGRAFLRRIGDISTTLCVRNIGRLSFVSRRRPRPPEHIGVEVAFPFVLPSSSSPSSSRLVFASAANREHRRYIMARGTRRPRRTMQSYRPTAHVVVACIANATTTSHDVVVFDDDVTNLHIRLHCCRLASLDGLDFLAGRELLSVETREANRKKRKKSPQLNPPAASPAPLAKRKIPIMTRPTPEGVGRRRWKETITINNDNRVGSNSVSGDHEASERGARREIVATRRLHRNAGAMSKKRRLAIESASIWRSFGRWFINREEIDEEDFPMPPQYTLSSRITTASSE